MVKISKIEKRDGKIIRFNQSKITTAIKKALIAVGSEDRELAKKLSDEVVEIIKRRFEGKIPNIEAIQDTVENVLIKDGYADAAKAYILYRQKHAGIRDTKKLLGVKDDLKLGINAIEVLKKRYLAKNENGEIIETPTQMFKRVAKAIAKVDKKYGKKDIKQIEEEFFQSMINLEFFPNSPTLMNAGSALGQLSACFVLPVDDSIEGIFNAVKYMALIHQSGGGTGFSFSQLRPKGDRVRSTKGIASGPISFMKVFDVATEVIKQGGRRRGANIGVLKVDHPDIMEFITAKSKEESFTNFNLSVGVTDEFMLRVENDEKYPLINPRNGEIEGDLAARNVFDLITTMAWKTGDPGVLFLDEIDRHNPTPKKGKIECTNPCGEVPLLYYESCNLGSINLSKMIEDEDKNKDKEINWEKLRKTIRVAIHFLDNIIDANKFPLAEVKKMTLANRKVGLGVMGFAEMLIKLNTPYDSQKAVDVAEKVMKFISEEAREKSVELGEEKGSFPDFKDSIWYKKGFKAMRNATVTTIAPTGTISIISGVSSGIEPLFAIVFIRNIMGGVKLLEVNPLFEEIAKKRGFYSEELMAKIAKKGSIQGIKEIPEEVRRIFVTALDIKPEWHVKMQAAFQEYTDNGVSKTVNLLSNASIDEVKRVYLLAYKLKCKGITVYRYGSKKDQVLNIGAILRKERIEPELEYVIADAEYAGGCPTPYICNS